MNTSAKNGYEAIAHVSQCFSDIQEYTNRMERELRELEAANDALQDELDESNKKLEELRKVKIDQTAAEIKRYVMDWLDKMPAERIKDYILQAFFDALEDTDSDEDEDEE